MPLDALGEPFVCNHDVTKEEEDGVPQEIGPGSASAEEGSEADQDEGQGDYDQEDGTPALGPRGQSIDQAPA